MSLSTLTLLGYRLSGELKNSLPWVQERPYLAYSIASEITLTARRSAVVDLAGSQFESPRGFNSIHRSHDLSRLRSRDRRWRDGREGWKDRIDWRTFRCGDPFRRDEGR